MSHTSPLQQLRPLQLLHAQLGPDPHTTVLLSAQHHASLLPAVLSELSTQNTTKQLSHVLTNCMKGSMQPCLNIGTADTPWLPANLTAHSMCDQVALESGLEHAVYQRFNQKREAPHLPGVAAVPEAADAELAVALHDAASNHHHSCSGYCAALVAAWQVGPPLLAKHAELCRCISHCEQSKFCMLKQVANGMYRHHQSSSGWASAKARSEL